MAEAKGNAGSSSRASVAAAPQKPTSSSKDSKDSLASAKRQVFSVELNPDETTIVSWKKLLKESRKGSANPHDSVRADSTADVAIQPIESEIKDAQPSNRLNAVIEKIERLYMGEQSSDGEELDIPDDDQYDTEDSFIDDAELDEYFQVDKLSTKHNGYFVNRGKLEHIKPSSSPIHDGFSHPSKPSSSPTLTPKRRKKDSTKLSLETSDMRIRRDTVDMGNGQINAAARREPLIGNKLANPANIQVHGEHCKEKNFLTNKPNTSSRRKSKDLGNKAGTLVSRDLAYKSRLINESVDSVYHASRQKPIPSHVESWSQKSQNYENEAEISTKQCQKERYGTHEFPSVDSAVGAHPMQATQPSSTRVKDSSATRHKGTTLEKAIRDLEKIVALCRPHNLDFQEVDTTDRGVKRRLPQEVKQKLSKVARLSASQNKIPEDVLIDRLMGIVGHIVQRKTLKRNLREIVELGLSAKQEKSDGFQQIKQEVNEMIKTRMSSLTSKIAEHQDGSADDFQQVNDSERKSLRRYGMDIALEDKICDLYNLYVEGLDADKGYQRKKLYGELAELWPNGYMDSNDIKDAICRSKDRKRTRIYRDKVREEERIKRKKLVAAARIEGQNPSTQVLSEQVRQTTDSTAKKLAPLEKVTNKEPTSLLSNSGNHHAFKIPDKARESSKTAVADAKKKTQRKPVLELEKTHGHPTKLPYDGKEKPSSHKVQEDPKAIHQPKPNLQLPGASVSCDPQS